MDHYFSKKPESAVKEHTLNETLRGVGVSFVTGSGMFSLTRVDPGSRTLIEYCEVEPNWHVLDLGCGYGPVGISLKKAIPSLHVAFTDINARAIAYLEKNLRKNLITDAVVHCGDGFANVTGVFDLILFNPPQSAGKAVCFSMISESAKFLKSQGRLTVVARKNKGGNSIQEHMTTVFGNVRVLAKKGGYWIYESTLER